MKGGAWAVVLVPHPPDLGRAAEEEVDDVEVLEELEVVSDGVGVGLGAGVGVGADA
jgi:hypothetical protein